MNIQTIIEFILALGSLIIIHELGHFLVAHLVKIDVEEFGIGFPPRAVTLFEAKGTKYSLNWLPFGGFVRLKGENDPNVPGSFASANPWKRIAVLVAGPLMNLLVAVILYASIISLIGMPDSKVVEVKEVNVNSPADLAGLQAGDIILRVNDIDINSTDALHLAIADNLGKEITLTYQRDTQEGVLTLTPRINPPTGEGAMGIVMGNPTRSVSPFVALPAGIVATYEHGQALLGFVGDIIGGRVSAEEGRLVGFKGMYDMYSQVRDSEPVVGIPPIVNVLAYITSITISLGLLNLLPIPAVDGGRILFILPELLFKRRIPQNYENLINLISFALLLLLLFYVNLQDFINPAQLP